MVLPGCNEIKGACRLLQRLYRDGERGGQRAEGRIAKFFPLRSALRPSASGFPAGIPALR